MNLEELKDKYYTAFKPYNKVRREDNQQPPLRQDLTWLNGRLHPFFLAVLAPALNVERREFISGTDPHGDVFVIFDEENNEILRLTHHQHGQEAMTTSALGAWMPAESSLGALPAYRLPSLRRSPFQDLRRALDALQEFGTGDDEIEVLHVGTHLSHKLNKASIISEHYRFAGAFVTLSYQPRVDIDARFSTLVRSLEEQLSETYPVTVVRTPSIDGSAEMAHFFGLKGIKSDGFVEDGDALLILEKASSQGIIPPYIKSQAEYLQPVLTKMAEPDDELGYVAYFLLNLLDTRCKVFQIINAPDDPYVTFHVAGIEDVDEYLPVYHLKVKK